MRLTLFFVLAFTVQLTHAQSAEDSAKTVVEKWIKAKLLEYPDTYSSTEFLEFDRRRGYSEEAERIKEQWLLAHHNELKRVSEDSTASPLPEEKQKELQQLKKRAAGLEEEHIGYTIRHRFSARDKYGNPLFYDGEFTLDKNFVVQESVIKESGESEERTN